MNGETLTLGEHTTTHGKTFEVRGWGMTIGKMRKDGSLAPAKPVAVVTIKYGGRLHKIKVDGRL